EQRHSVEEERKKILAEAEKIKQDAQAEAERIKKEAEDTAFQVMQKNNAEIRKTKEQAQQEAQKITEDARAKTSEIEQEAGKKAEELCQQSRQKGYQEGVGQGYAKGEEEVKRLIDRLHVIINAAIDKRKEIIDSAERQLIDLVLLVARKVVKAISEEQKSVVLENIREAMKKVRAEAEVTIKVNTSDLELASKHKKEFISAVEGLKNITVEEDSRVDPGGCIIETSFGEVDARVQKQLQIIEEKIRELAPISE
ncbi:MAG: flagellar assembly protein FliH, partial [Spirochaetota bacterium]